MSFESLEALLIAELERIENKIIDEGLPGLTVVTISDSDLEHKVTMTMESEDFGWIRLTFKPVLDSIRQTNAMRRKGWTHPDDEDIFGDARRPKFRWSKTWGPHNHTECAKELTYLLRTAYKITPEMIFEVRML